MQKTAPASWTTDDLALSPRLVRLRVVPGTRGGSVQRCQRCDIPLGSQICPNPLCGEQHGQSAGDLCAWCRHNHEERMDVIDFARLHDLELEVLPALLPHQKMTKSSPFPDDFRPCARTLVTTEAG